MYTIFIVYITIVAIIFSCLFSKKIRRLLAIIAGGGVAVAIYFLLNWGLL